MNKKILTICIVTNIVIALAFLGIYNLGVMTICKIDMRAFTFLFCGIAIFLMGFLSRLHYKKNVKDGLEDVENINSVQ